MSVNPLENKVYRLEDLARWPVSHADLAVVGCPVRHSLSPLMHTAALAVMGRLHPLFLSWKYHAFEIEPEEIGAAVAAFGRAGFRGVNLTVPHKQVVLPFLQDLDPAAARLGAVNTLLRTAAGWQGYNTDGYGLAQAVREAFGYGFAGKRVVLLGAGGAARAAAVQMVEAGVERLLLVNRTAGKRDELVALLRGMASYSQVIEGGESKAARAGRPIDLLINATSCGLRPDDPLPLGPDQLPDGCDVFDMIYNPARTPLLRAAGERGHRTANGLGMLVHQGARSLELWSGQRVPVEAMFRSLAQCGFSAKPESQSAIS